MKRHNLGILYFYYGLFQFMLYLDESSLTYICARTHTHRDTHTWEERHRVKFLNLSLTPYLFKKGIPYKTKLESKKKDAQMKALSL